jgi:hypothetical protein
MAIFTTGQAGGQAIQPTSVPAAYTTDAQDLARSQRLAQMLTASPMPEGQMISGRYVAPSITQNLAQLANMATGAYFSDKAEKQNQALAEKLRTGETQAIADFMKTKQGTPAEMFAAQAGPMPTGGNIPLQESRAAVAPNPQAAFANLYQDPRSPQRLRDLAFTKMMAEPEAFTLAENAKRFITMPDGTVKEVATGAKKFRAPIQVDTGTHIEFRDAEDPTKLLQKIPKSQMPSAGQIYESSEGPLLVNTRAGTATPLMGTDGKPLAPKLSSEQSKDITAINQQRASINGAIADVKANKSAFSFGRGVAQNAPYGESIAGRFEKPEDTQARAYVFNNVSAVIKERAGTAQSAQELTRLNSFLPATTDNADQIVAKLEGFNKYLDDQEKGTRVPTFKKPDASKPTSFSSEADVQKAISGGTLKKGDKVTVNGVTGTIQ